MKKFAIHNLQFASDAVCRCLIALTAVFLFPIFPSICSAEIFTHTFATGEYFISLPFTPKDTNPLTVFGIVFSTNPQILTYNTENQKWLRPSDNLRLESGKGYWVWFDKETRLSLEGAPTTPSQPFTIAIKKGWNLIGNPYDANIRWDDNIKVDGIGISQSTKILNALWKYNDSNKYLSKQDARSTFIRNNLYKYDGSNKYKSANVLLPWNSYWVKANENAVLSISYATATNLPPIANAGVDQSVAAGTQVTLDASASSDPDDDPITYLWTQISGATVTLSSTTASKATFLPTATESYTFTLTVSDDKLTIASDSVIINVVSTGTTQQSQQWIRYPLNPVYTNHPTNPELSFVGDPGVFYHNGIFYLWYASLVHFYATDTVPYGPCDPVTGGNLDPPKGCALPIEFATSTDGINWKRFDRGTPNDRKDDYILLRDSDTSWDSGSIETPTIVFDEITKKFKMWFSGTKQSPTEAERGLSLKVGCAESSDGINWKKYDNPVTTAALYDKSDPVLSPRPDNWDSAFVGDPTVIKDGTKYKMWYGGGGIINTTIGATLTVAIGYAESDDGINWTRRDQPVLIPDIKEEGYFNGPHVLKVGDTYELWHYVGLKSGIFYATSKDGINWERKGVVLPLGDYGRWDDEETSSPSVVYINGNYWMYYTGSRCAMEGTRVKRGECWSHIKIGLATKGNITVDPGSIENRPPIANVGADQTVTFGTAAITLDGSKSFDPDGDVLIYYWSQTSGTPVTLSSTTTQRASFTATMPGTYIFTLLVDDINGHRASDTVTIIVKPADTGAPGTLKWSFSTGYSVWSSPAIGDDGTIYVGSEDNKLYAINPDGTQKWTFTTGHWVESSPAIGSDGTIYVGSYDMKLYAVNPDGTQKWAFTTTAKIDSSSAIGNDGTIYVGSYDGNLYAINPDGTQKWAFTTNNQMDPSPAIGTDGTIYAVSNGEKLYAINPDGTQKWIFTIGGRIYLYSSPAIGADRTIYLGSDDNKLYAINSDGAQKWTFTTGGWIDSSPAIGADGTIYISSIDKKLYAINPNGTQKWAFVTDRAIFSSPAIGSDGTIYISSPDKKLYAINPDGTQKWAFTAGDEIYSSPAIAPDGTIYVGSKDGKLYAVYSDSKGLANSPWPKFRHDSKNTGAK